MKAIFLSPLSLPCSLQPHHCPLETHFSNPILWSKISSITPKPWSFRNINTVIVPRANPRDPKESKKFMDENGAVDDMDGYLNYLSLEYDSVWDTKPYKVYHHNYVITPCYQTKNSKWCQPWTITLTGVLVIACSWLILHSVIVSTVVLSLISAWWYIFLYSYPKVYSDMIAERRKKVTNGVEDTFGLRKSR